MDDDKLTFEGTRLLADQCLCANIQRAARSIGRRFDEAFRPLGLNNWQFTVMAALNRPEPPTINVVAHDLAIDRTTLTGNLKPLERRGLVSVKADAVDKRARRIALTEDGQHLLQQAYVVWKRVQGRLEHDLEPVDIDAFRTTLRTVAAA